MTVDVTYCLGEWKKYFTEKPLSFNKFVDTYAYKEAIYPHILKTIDEISSQPSKCEFFIQGFIGSGKTTLIYLLLAYRIYLYLILKSAKTYYDVASSAKLSMVIFAPGKKTADLTVSALIHVIENIPFFKRMYTVKDFLNRANDVVYTTSYPNDILTFRKNDNLLHVIAVKNENYLKDIIINPIFGVLTELDSFIKDDITSDQIFSFYQKLSWKIKSCCKGKLSTIIVEKNPYSLYDDVIYQIMHATQASERVVVFYHYYWQIFKDKDPTAKLDSIFNTTTCQVVEKEEDILPGDSFVEFPSVFNGMNLLEFARNKPKQFLRDIIGMPTVMEHRSDMLNVMKDIAEAIHKNNLEICIKNSGVYLECPAEKLSMCISN